MPIERDDLRNELKVVYMEWVDSTAFGQDGRWIDLDEVEYDPEQEQMLTCFTAGFLAKETDTEYRIIQSCHDGGKLAVSSILIIPKVAVTKIKVYPIKNTKGKGK